MKTPDTRDRALETVLRTRVASGPASADCLDAETLAAWVDHGLDEPSLRRAEAHMADCARCQTLLATLVSTAPEPAPRVTGGEMPSESWWSFDIRWLIPLAGAATAVLLWMVVPDRDSDLRPATETDAPALAGARQAPPPPAEVMAATHPSNGAAERQADSAEQKLARADPPTAAAERGRLAGRAAERTVPASSRDARERRTAVEGAVGFAGRQRAVALVEAPHVAAERNHADRVLDAVGVTAGAQPQGPAEADRVTQTPSKPRRRATQ